MNNKLKKLTTLCLIISLISIGSIPALAAADESGKYEWDHVLMGCYGFVTGMVIHPQDSNLIYVRTDVGGMYRYDSDNQKWIQLMESIAHKDTGLASVRSIALDPNDTNIVYAACGGGSGTTDIIKSTDRGKTWSFTNFSNNQAINGVPLFCGNNRVARAIGEALVVDPNNSDIIYFGTAKNGFYRSEDKGANWSKISDIPDYGWPTGGVASVYIDKSKQKDGCSSDIYVSSWGYGVYKSTDCGKSFSLIEGSPRVPCQVQVVTDDAGKEKMYVSSYNPNLTDYYVGEDNTGKVETDEIGSFWLYENGEWTDLHPEKSSVSFDSYAQNTSFSSFMIDSRNPDVILLNAAPWSIKNVYMWLSTDGGESFKRITRSRQATALIQDPNAPDNVWMPYGGGVNYIENFKTVTQPEDFIKSDTGIETICANKMVSLPSEEAPLLLIESLDHSLRVQEQLDVLAPDNAVEPTFHHGGGIDFCEEDPSFVFRTGINGRFNYGTGTAAYSTDYGRTYTEVTGWDSTMRIVDCAVGATKQANGFPVLMVVSVGRSVMDDSGNVVDDGEGRGVYRSKDGGATWELVTDFSISRKKATNDLNNHILASDRVDGNTFYYVEKPYIYRTTNGGDTWKTLEPTVNGEAMKIPQYGAAIKAIPTKTGHLWLKGMDGKVYTTSDFGKNWSLLDNIIEANSDGCSFGFGIGNGDTDYPAAYMAGYVDGEFGMYISNDLGQRWVKITPASQNFFAGIVDICGDRRQYGRVFAATGGTGVIYGEGTPITDIINYSPGDSLTVTANTVNTTSVSQNFTIFAAFYNPDKSLLNVQSEQFVSEPNSGENEFTLSVTVPSDANRTTLKVFIFTNNLTPLHMALEKSQIE